MFSIAMGGGFSHGRDAVVSVGSVLEVVVLSSDVPVSAALGVSESPQPVSAITRTPSSRTVLTANGV
jgi:hypothetical protein